MAIPPHSLLIFQRPKEGSTLQRRVLVLNYNHSIAAQGGYDTMSCDVAVRSQTEGQEYLSNYLGSFVQAFADDPCIPIWEGLINRLTFNSGGASYTTSMDELANRVSVIYTGAANVAAETTIANSTASQNIYGIKQDQVEFGADPSAGTQRTRLRDTILAQRAYPQTSITQGGGQTNLVHLECIGIFHTIEWEKRFTVTGAGATAANTRMGQLLAAIGNASTFFDVTDTSQVATNAGSIANQQRGKTIWQEMLEIAESGDATNYWVVSVTPTDWNRGTRVLRYQQMNAAIEYTARQADGLRIRDLYGRIVPPWTVKPDRGIRVTDVLVGFNSAVTTDPRETYIFDIQYDANQQRVQYNGADDTTAQGAFMLKRGFKGVGRKFGASLRVIVT